ncbi:MAG: hypothetical protein M3Z09_10205 [Acidobacteriota bacterium]|nr:hypothetical protein [Acidobacteriota bacterium]
MRKCFAVLLLTAVCMLGAPGGRGGGHSGGSRGGFSGGGSFGRGGSFGSGGYRGGYNSGGYNSHGSGYRGGYGQGGYRGGYGYGGYRGGYGYRGYGYGGYGFGLGFGLGLGGFGFGYGGFDYPGYGYGIGYGYDAYPGYSYGNSYAPAYYYEPAPVVTQTLPSRPVVVNQYYSQPYSQPATATSAVRERQDPPPGRDAQGQLQTLIAFPDGSVQIAVAYWTTGNTLHYVTRDKVEKQVALGLIDRAMTDQLNRERHVQFRP